ncbi:MAG: FtsX-like permease family protein [Acidobacteriaceae bacterium]|nr:FtsX-like permease family protein [Acidobacteriaceae bacterium]
MNKLIVGNLIHRPLRSVISALAVAIEVVMILSISGVMFGILDNSRMGTTGIGGDMLTHPGASTALMNTSAASADVRIANVLRALPHVQVVAPINIKLTMGASLENIYGIDYASFNDLRPFVFKSGGPFQQPFDMIVDDLQAASGKGLKVGDTVKALNHQFRVCGIVEHGKGARKFIQLTTMDSLDGSTGKASAFYIKTEDAPKYQNAVRKELLATDGLQGWSVQTLDELLSSLTPERMPGFNIALRVVIGIAIVIGFLVIFQSMYTAVMERTREIGILKSMGSSKFDIVSVVLRETGLLAVVGVVLGIAGTYILRSVLHARFPTQSFSITPGWVSAAVCIALSGALLGALYPAWKAARKDPIDALSYE